MAKKKSKTPPIKGNNGTQFLNGEGKIQLSMPKESFGRFEVASRTCKK